MKLVDYSARFDTRYTFWSGITGGLFVQLAYFGTDQSQVQRYLGGSSLAESRLGLLMNGLVKLPMQLMILFVGVLLFTFYQFHAPPVCFNPACGKMPQQIESQGVAANDADYIFIGFVLAQFPSGLLGLLIAVILCAAMSATAAALSSLGQTTVVDFYKPRVAGRDDHHYLSAAKWFTVGWGLVAVAFAAFASLLENLIQAVNILGSIFYGPMLGVFLVGFFFPRVRATPAFIATLAAQAIVVAVFATSSIGFLWYNVIGCAAVIAISWTLSLRA